MVKITAEYEGGLHCQAVHGPSGARISTDAPVDNHGRGESFSPTDLVATALATCILTILGIQADRQGWDLNGMKVEIEKHMTSQAPRRIARLPVHLHMPVAMDEDNRRRVESAAHACPVHRSLHPDIDAPIVLHWPNH